MKMGLMSHHSLDKLWTCKGESGQSRQEYTIREVERNLAQRGFPDVKVDECITQTPRGLGEVHHFTASVALGAQADTTAAPAFLHPSASEHQRSRRNRRDSRSHRRPLSGRLWGALERGASSGRRPSSAPAGGRVQRNARLLQVEHRAGADLSTRASAAAGVTQSSPSKSRLLSASHATGVAAGVQASAVKAFFANSPVMRPGHVRPTSAPHGSNRQANSQVTRPGHMRPSSAPHGRSREANGAQPNAVNPQAMAHSHKTGAGDKSSATQSEAMEPGLVSSSRATHSAGKAVGAQSSVAKPCSSGPGFVLPSSAPDAASVPVEHQLSTAGPRVMGPGLVRRPSPQRGPGAVAFRSEVAPGPIRSSSGPQISSKYAHRVAGEEAKANHISNSSNRDHISNYRKLPQRCRPRRFSSAPAHSAQRVAARARGRQQTKPGADRRSQTTADISERIDSILQGQPMQMANSGPRIAQSHTSSSQTQRLPQTPSILPSKLLGNLRRASQAKEQARKTSKDNPRIKAVVHQATNDGPSRKLLAHSSSSPAVC